ncbi:MAG: NAD(P)H-hydrate dehydratase [Methylacidiphilales bacterium]|nr:NAD(P)H-hydrate dehydratase [Candidatus Methylacidiphilales bacterium]
MDILSKKEMVAREEECFRSGLTAAALMEAAGEAMARRILEIYPRAKKLLVLVGKGNNGGDGLVVARHLSEQGKPVRVVLTAPEDQLGELPRTRLDRLRAPFPELEIEMWHDGLPFPGSDGVVIDALLGLQASGPLRGLLAEVVARLNRARAEHFFRTVALDLPTGLAAYEEGKTPENRDAAVVADVTMAVGFAKEVLTAEAPAGWVGRLEVVAWSREKMESAPQQILIGHELAGLLPRRNALSHKNDFGRIVIVAGSPGFTGAPALCAQAALAMGAGLLSVVTRPEVANVVAAQSPHEAMVSGWNDEVPDVVRNASAIVIGPGLGVDKKTTEMLRAVLQVGCSVLIDADGLNTLAQNPGLLREAKGPVVLTPHPGEMGRLIGRKFEATERESVAREFVDQHNVVLVLKGTRTLVTARGKQLFLNTTGNPGLSTGGSGDTLSGMIGALLAQKLAPLDAARLGVWLHGHAADLVLAERGCEEGLTPTMLSGHLGQALVSLRAQAAVVDGLVERAKLWR